MCGENFDDETIAVFGRESFEYSVDEVFTDAVNNFRVILGLCVGNREDIHSIILLQPRRERFGQFCNFLLEIGGRYFFYKNLATS